MQNSLKILSLSYRENDGTQVDLEPNTIQVLTHRPQTLKLVFQAILGNDNAASKLHRSGVSFEATVAVNQRLYRIFPADGICRAYDGSKDMTEQYRHMLRHTREEMDLVCFRQPKGYPLRLSQYRLGRICTLQYTRPVGFTATFQFHMRRFIREFQPQRLVPGKELYLYLFRDGTFRVRLGDTENPTLSETEQVIYHLLCFLHLQRFWAQILELHSLDGPVLPVLIPDVLSRIDESVDRNDLLRLAAQLNRQVIFLD